MSIIEKIINTLFLEELGVFIPTSILFLYFFFYIQFQKKKFILKIIFFLIPVINIFYNYSFIPDYISALGQDSFLEIDSDLAEAIFYIKTLFTFLFDIEIFRRPRFWFILIFSFFSGLTLFLIIKILSEKIKKVNFKLLFKYFNYLFYAAIILVLINASSLIYKNYKIGDDLKKITDNSKEKFKNNIKNFRFKKNLKDELLIVNYIGESSSALNFSLYGYPFETTPWLSSQKNNNQFVYFKNVYARYTHTTPSLVDTFSICQEIDTNACSSLNIKDLNFLPIVNILEKNSIKTHLFSTQGSLGGHNIANKIVLNVNNKNFSGKKESKFLGNRKNTKIKDKEFFKNSYCLDKKIFNKNTSDVVFLHSYAGHGFYDGYLGHTDKKKLFLYPQYITPKNFLGKDERNFKLTQEYDTAINYIDETIEEVISCSLRETEKTNKPLIFIYFSDHGESPYSARGHDSSRLTYEMLHVPFFMYFNDAAYKKYRERFDFMNSLSEKNLSLNIMSEIFLYLFDIEIYDRTNLKINLKEDSIKNFKTENVLIRKNLNGKITKIPTLWHNQNVNKNLTDLLDNSAFQNQDVSISLWQLNNYLKTNELSNKSLIKNLVCQHRANSFILQYKNSMSNGCFETDVYFLKNKVISAHGLEINTNLVFDNFFESNYQKNTIWMDSKNLNENKNCQFALQWLKKNSKNLESILVELPTNSIENLYSKKQEWINCVKEIDSIANVEVAYYMNNDLLDQCSTAIKKNNLEDKKLFCDQLYSKTKNLIKKINVKSITYDFTKGKEAVLNDPSLNLLKWHVWHVDNLLDFQFLTQRNNTGIILLKNNQSLNNIN